jgi:DNA-binding XRE family transcriptional regulator
MVFPTNMRWQERLRLARIALHLTQGQLAEVVGSSRRRIWFLERRAEFICKYEQQKLAEALCEPVESIFKGAKESKR